MDSVMDIMETVEFRTVEGESLTRELVEELTKRVFTKADYRRQLEKMRSSFPGNSIITQAPIPQFTDGGGLTPSDMENIDATSLVWLCQHLLYFSGDDLAEDFLAIGGASEYYRGEQKPTITDSEDGMRTVGLSVGVGYFYARLIAAMLARYTRANVTMRSRGLVFSINMRVRWEDSEEAIEPFEDGGEKFTFNPFRVFDRGTFEVFVCFKLAKDNNINAMHTEEAIRVVAAAIVGMHLTGLRTMCGTDGKLFRAPDTPLTRIWQLAFEVPKDGYVRTCPVCKNTFVAKNKKRKKCHICSNYRGHLQGNRRKVY